MTLSPPHPGLHGGVGGSGVKWGEAEQFATHLYLQLSVAFRGWGSRRVAMQNSSGGERNVQQKSQKKKNGRLVAKRKNMEAETRPQSETRRVILVLNWFLKKLFSSRTFLSKKGAIPPLAPATAATLPLLAAANKLDSWCISWNRHTPGSVL